MAMRTPFIGHSLLPLALICLACRPEVSTAPSGESDLATSVSLPVPPLRQSAHATDASASASAIFAEFEYEPAISSPASMLGRALGDGIAHHHDIVRAFETWSKQSERMILHHYADSYEGRPLHLAIISSPKNLAALDGIKSNLAQLADPRKLSPERAEALITTTPAVAWLAYSIHGDETSGSDAALALGYQLAAGRGPALEALLDELVIVIDPSQNPDGRERVLSQIEQSSGHVPHHNYRGMHRGRWPFGRGDHYHFDLNRDWLAGVNPATRARWRAVASLRPQLFVDAHEMGALDTFLFYPRAQPLNPHTAPTLEKWTTHLAADQARAFDRLGWSYYTREWADGWYPGYTDAWTSLTGAIGMLYEQARFAGHDVKRAAGEIESYAEAVHGQLVSSWANLQTTASHREEILRDYYRHRRAQTQQSPRALVVRAGHHPAREARWLRDMLDQGIEVHRATQAFGCSDVQSPWTRETSRGQFEPGTYLVFKNQPEGGLVRALLEFDTHMPQASLERERAKLERGEGSAIYDVTAWSLPLAHDLDAHWCTPRGVQGQLATHVDPGQRSPSPEDLTALDAAYAWVVDGRSDASVALAARALEHGLHPRLAGKSFRQGEVEFARGSLLFRRREHVDQPDLARNLAGWADELGAQLTGVATGRSPDDGPDLGGQSFDLLARPRVALLGNAPMQAADYGHVWHHLDRVLQLPFTALDAQAFDDHDLRRYNVLIIPPADARLRDFLADHRAAIEQWLRSGGTLIAMGSSAAALVGDPGEDALSRVRLRRDVLGQLHEYEEALEREVAARSVEVDPARLWAERERKRGQTQPRPDSLAPGDDQIADAQRLDAWQRRFAPSGVILGAQVSTRSWLTVGADENLPVFVAGDTALMARDPVSTPVRLGTRGPLRLSGLLWPEARERLEGSAYATVEALGKGQIILFAENPVYRGYFTATARVFSNAVTYGPGLGGNPPIEW